MNPTTTSLAPDFFISNFETISWFIYLIAALLFIQGLRLMNSPKTARKGNQVSITGMILAVAMALITSFYNGLGENYVAIFALGAGILLGVVGGAISAKKVKMTDMPQLVSIFNTVGGGAAALVAINDLVAPASQESLLPKSGHIPGTLELFTTGQYKGYVNSTLGINGFIPFEQGLTGSVNSFALFAAVLGIVIGCITFTGSLIAAGKLQGVVTGNAVKIPLKVLIDIACLCGIAVSGYMIISGNAFGAPEYVPVLLICAFSLILGLTFALPIGGADMPVVISILNACTGTAVAMAGFVINNLIMIVAGALVGAAGSILSVLMAKAMNRSLISVLAGGFGGSDSSAAVTSDEQITKETSADDVAVLMSYAKKVIVVPGYGLAVAGAQHIIADMTKLLEAKGVEVLFAIHPVAGRMPGHMNVLLAEANIPYEKLLDLDEVNDQFSTADVALVVGANDVTNPAARKAGNPISGMPILDVDNAKNVIVNKRGRGKGYAGIENELYGLSQTSMLYGDAKTALQSVVSAIKEL